MVVYTGDKCGEELLAEYYAPIASASMIDMKNNPMQLRPVTPHSFAGKMTVDGHSLSPQSDLRLDTSLVYAQRPSTQPKTGSSRSDNNIPHIDNIERPRTSSSHSRKASRDTKTGNSSDRPTSSTLQKVKNSSSGSLPK